MPGHNATEGNGSVGARDEAALLAEVRRGGGAFERVVLTENRRVMASIAEKGRTLRLHRAFAQASPEVLHALAQLFTERSARARVPARKVVNAFLADLSPAPARRRARAVRPGDEPHLARLRAEFARVNHVHFGDLLPEVPIYLSGRMRSRLGHFVRDPAEIVISRRLCERAHPDEALQTLRHEMIHLWQHVEGEKPDHGRAFRSWARALEVHPRARKPVRWC